MKKPIWNFYDPRLCASCASALYGSDAIGGVVNFILKKNQTAGEIAVSANLVEKKGGESVSASVTKGFGDLDRDGFNILASLSFEKQKRLKAINRDFAKSGIIKGIDGQNAGLRLFSSNSVPGNVILSTPDGLDTVAFYSPYLTTQGSCPALHVVNGETCRFDFASQVDLVPESQRTTGLLTGRLKLGNDHQLFSELVLSRFSNKPTFAPPAQPGLPFNQALYDRHVSPYLAANGLTDADIGTLTDGDPNNDPSYNVRVFDAGGRRDKYTYDTTHWVLGAEGLLAGWDYKTALTLSRQKFIDEAIGGYLSTNAFNAAIANGSYDPLAATAGTAVAALAPAVLKGEYDRNLSVYNSVNLSGSRPLFKMGGGDAVIAVGGEYARQQFRNDPSTILQSIGDSIIGGGGGVLPFNTTRNSYGVFSEALFPITKQVELTGSVRYDNYDAAKNSRVFDDTGAAVSGSRQEGKKANSGTWKLAARFQPTKDALIRASYGTGFKAPTLANITSPLQAFGVTTGSYDCPFTGADPLAASCSPPDSQYNILQGGNAATGASALKPEKSKQFTAGFVVEPVDGFSVGMDYWQVSIKDQIDNIPEAVAFANPETFRSLFRVAPDPVTGRNQLTFIQQPINISEARTSGIDLNFKLLSNTGIGKLTTSLAGTYMLKSEFTVPGLDGFQSRLGKFSVQNDVTFRWQLAGAVTLESGNWSTTFTGNYRSGYRDHQAKCSDPTLTDAQCNAGVNAGTASWVGPEIRTINPTTGNFGARRSLTREVAEYTTFDLQTKYSVTKALDITLGIKNLLGEDPPFSVQDAGGGNMRGYDGRYADPLGRVWTLKANYKF